MCPKRDEDAAISQRPLPAELREAISNLLDKGGEPAFVDLVGLVLTEWARRFPAKLSAAEQAAILKTVTSATPELIAERALTTEGLHGLLSILNFTQRIAIDYTPKSYAQRYAAADAQHPTETADFKALIQQIHNHATASGLSVFGATTLLVLHGSSIGLDRGLPWQMVARTLIETLSLVLKHSAHHSPELQKEADERAIQALMFQLKVSRRTALKYLADARAMGLRD